MSYWGWKFKFTARIWLSKIIVRPGNLQQKNYYQGEIYCSLGYCSFAFLQCPMTWTGWEAGKGVWHYTTKKLLSGRNLLFAQYCSRAILFTLQVFDCQKLLLGREIYSKKIIIRAKFTVHAVTVHARVLFIRAYCSPVTVHSRFYSARWRGQAERLVREFGII
jgi:hypothetical protein